MLRDTRGRRATATSPRFRVYLGILQQATGTEMARSRQARKSCTPGHEAGTLRNANPKDDLPSARWLMMRDGAETAGANSKPTLLTAPIREHAELAETALLTAEGCQCRGLPMGCGARWEREGIKHEVHEDGEPGLQVSVALLSFSNHPLPFLFFSSCVDCFGIWGWNHGIWRCNPALFLFFG